MRDQQSLLPSGCLGALLLLVVFSACFTSVANALDGDVKVMEVDGNHSLPVVNLKQESNRNTRSIFMTTLAVGEVVIALTDFVIGNVRESFGIDEADKDHREVIHHFERIQMELEQQKEELRSINREIQKLGLSIIYSEHEEKIKDSLWTLRDYLTNPNDRNRNVFTEKAVHLDQSIRILVDGLLGQHSFSPDIMAVLRDVAKCDSRKLRKNVMSVGSLVMAGLRVRGLYQRIMNATELDSSPFKKYIDTSLNKLETRLDDMATECQADETNVSDEMRKIMEATLAHDRKTVAVSLLEFLEEKYDTKKWIVLVQEKSWDNSVWSGGFHHVLVRNDVAFAISVDRRAENFPDEFRKLINLHSKEFTVPKECSKTHCYCLSSIEMVKYLNRFLVPIRAKTGVEIETLASSSEVDLNHLIVATSKGVEQRYVTLQYTPSAHGWCHHWAIAIPKRPSAIPFSPSPYSRLRNQIECSYDPDRATQDYGPLRNERTQAYLSVRDDSNEEGASIILDREWRNSSGQKWKFVDGQLRNKFGKCLTLRYTFLASIHYLYQYDCDRYKREQRWHRHGLQITIDKKNCLVFNGEVHSKDPMLVTASRVCGSSPSYIWYNRDTDCEDAVVIPSTTNGSRPLRNEFSRFVLNVVGNYGTEQPWSNRPRQLWKFVDGLLKNDHGKCLAGKVWHVWSVDCADQIGNNGRWTYTEDRQIRSEEGYCLSSAGDENGYVYYDYCRDEPRQRWWYFL